MNIDDVARRAGRDLRESVDTDVDMALETFRELRSRRRRTHAVIASVSVAAALVVIAGLAQVLGAGAHRGQGPIRPPTEAPSSSQTAAEDLSGCDAANVTCLGQRTYTVYVDAPITWTVPRGFGAPYSGFLRGAANNLTRPPGRGFVESRSADGRSGVAVVEHVSAAGLGASPRAVPGVLTAREFATWVASRPFLTSSKVESEDREEGPAWTAEARVATGAGTGPATCADGQACFPLMTIPHGDRWWVGGMPEGMVGRFTALDVHGSGITVIWSWSLDGEIPPDADALADSIRFD